MHNGVRETLTVLRSRFRLTKRRQVIRKQIFNCVVGRRHEGRSYKVDMARNSGHRNSAHVGLHGNMAAKHSKKMYGNNKTTKTEQVLAYREQVL